METINLPIEPTTSLHRVFAIPELAANVLSFLRPINAKHLRCVSKALYNAFEPALALKITSHIAHNHPDLSSLSLLFPLSRDGQHPVMHRVIRTLFLELETESSRWLLDRLCQDMFIAQTLRTLTVQYLDVDNGALLALILTRTLTHCRQVEHLSLDIKTDLDSCLLTLAQTRPPHLRSLTLLEDNNRKTYRRVAWPSLVKVLQTCPMLDTLTLEGIFIADQPMAALGSVSVPPPPPPSPSPSIPAANVGGGHLFPEQNSPLAVVVPSFKSLTLRNCVVVEKNMQDLNRLFPQLETLHIENCRGTWINCFLGDEARIDPLQVLFAKLRALRIWIVLESQRGSLVRLVEGRPELRVLETDIMPVNKAGVMELVRYCSSDYVTEGEKVRPMNRFEKVLLQTYVTGGYSDAELMQLFGAKCFHGLRSIYYQLWEISVAYFPFAWTMTELHLAGRDEQILQLDVPVLNTILRSMQNLEILKIDRQLEDYRIFEGLGRAPDQIQDSSLQDTENISFSSSSSPSIGDAHYAIPVWRKERPFLLEVEIYVVAREVKIAKLNMGELKEQVVDRFRFLERLRVRTWRRHGLDRSSSRLFRESLDFAVVYR